MNSAHFPPASRRTDPATSREAERAVTRSGKRAGDAAKIVRFLRGADQPLTACEIAVRMRRDGVAIDRYAVSRRLPEMERSGAVERCLPRRCAVNGTAQTTWRARR